MTRRPRSLPVHCLLILWSLTAATITPAAEFDDKECLWCHGKESITRTPPDQLVARVRVPPGEEPFERKPEEVLKLYTPDGVLDNSVHHDLQCTDCHRDIPRLPHDQRLAPVTCEPCHEQIRADFALGPHAREAPGTGRPIVRCGDCHSPPHLIKKIEDRRTYDRSVASVTMCMPCHDREEPGQRNVVHTYYENIHGHTLFKAGLPFSATCVDCHGKHAMLPASDPDSPLYPLNIPDTCGSCHEGVEDVFYASVHGRELKNGNAQGATCTSCHSSHGIGNVTEAFLGSVVEECSHCHLDLGRSYMTSYHGKATALGDHSVAVCSSCHGFHDILPVRDSRSRVAPENLIETCGECHEGSNENFVQYSPHVVLWDRQRFPAVFYTWLGMTVLLLGVLAVFVPHALLWAIRETVERLKTPLRRHHRPAKEERYIERFRPVHRWTHFLIVVSFTGLVATGFPLKYSYTEWAKEFSARLGGAHVMGLLHRGFAILTFVYAGIHILHLLNFFLRKCPRPRFKFLFGPNSMVFRLDDLKTFWAMMRWFFFLGPRPRFDRWTYLEKFDYWGEAWGIFVIGGSGLVLWFPEFFTRWLPGWVLNCAMVVHSIEALLAASVIFMVHFLNTHLRPDKFPVDMVMLTGRMSESEMKEERAAEYERLVATGEIEARLVPPVALRWRILGAIAGIIAFLTGVSLIVAAFVSEYKYFMGG